MWVRPSLRGLAALPTRSRSEPAGHRHRLRRGESRGRPLVHSRGLPGRSDRAQAGHHRRVALRRARCRVVHTAHRLAGRVRAPRPSYLRAVAAVPRERLGVYVALVWVGATVLAVLAGRLADDIGAIPAVLGAAGLVTAACVLMALSGRSEPLVAFSALLLGAT